MTTTPTPDVSALSTTLRSSWQRFLETFEPLRPELYRYCRYLTRSPWDAEDLVQDTMARAFVTLACLVQELPHPRPWLLRVASNLWIDRTRRQRRELPGEVPEDSVSGDPRAPREAVGTLVGRLAPQERAAVVLKDVFDLTLEETAEALSTTVGAVKTALHRGRGKLTVPEPCEESVPVPAVLDAFCDAFNARDLDRLTSLLLDSSCVEMIGTSTEYGPEAARNRALRGSMGVLRWNHELNCGIPERFLVGYLPEPPRCELRIHRGEPLLLFWYAHVDGEAVRTIGRVETEGDRVSRLRNYFFCSDVIAEVCKELDVPYRINGYSYWTRT